MNCYDVIGYVHDGAMYCADCKPDAPEDEIGVVFGESETDCPSHCDTCGEYIPESLTMHGVAYVLNAALEHVHALQGTSAHDTDQTDSCVYQWLERLRWYGMPRRSKCLRDALMSILEGRQ